MRSRLQDQRRATGARRHVGHAPELRREQRAGGLLEASHDFLTTASAADLPAFDGHAHRRLPIPSRLRTLCSRLDRSARNDIFEQNAGTSQVLKSDTKLVRKC